MAEEMKRMQHDFEDVDPQPVQERIAALKEELASAATNKEQLTAKAQKDLAEVCILLLICHECILLLICHARSTKGASEP